MKKKQYSAPAVTTVAVEAQHLMDNTSLTTPPNTIPSDGGTITVNPSDTESTVDGGDVMSKENDMWE